MTPGGTILFNAVRELKHAELVYAGRWLDPLRESMDAFMEKLTETTSGSATLKLYKGPILQPFDRPGLVDLGSNDALATATTAISRFSTIAATAAPRLNRLFQLTLSRFYGSVATAQPRLDPDYYYDYCQAELERNRHRLYSVPVADTEGRETRRGVQWAFIGSPRTRKHVYAQMLSKLLEVPRISMASLVRQDLSPRSSLYKQIANAVNRGEIVPEDIIFGLLSKRFKDGYYRGEDGFILDGIPRTPIQAEILDQLAEIDLVVNFKCTEDFVMKNQGGSWKENLQAFNEQSNPLEDYYRNRKKLLQFQVSSAPVETWQGLLTALHLQHINAVHSSQELITRFHLL